MLIVEIVRARTTQLTKIASFKNCRPFSSPIRRVKKPSRNKKREPISGTQTLVIMVKLWLMPNVHAVQCRVKKLTYWINDYNIEIT